MKVDRAFGMKIKVTIPVELVKRAQKGDQAALEDLLIKSDKLIWNASSDFFLGSETKDIVQEVKLTIIEELPGLRNPHAYPSWVRLITQNLCKDFLKKKKPVLLKDESEIEEGSETQNIFDSQGFGRDSREEFKKAEEAIEHKERIERISNTLDQEELGLLKLHYLYGLTLQEIAPLKNLKKSSCAEKIEIAKARWILEEANYDWAESNFNEAKGKLIIIASDFKPDEASKEKRYLLALALTRLGDIHQVLGRVNESIDFLLRSQKVWENLKDKTMASYANHMIALCNNISGKYEEALGILDEVKEDYGGVDSHTKRLYGDLERDMGSIYTNLGEIKLAKLHIEKSLRILEDADHRESYYAALRKCGEIEIRLKQFDKAYDTLQESIKHSPPYRALHHLQTEIALVDLFFSSNEIEQAFQHAKEAEKKAKEFGFRHQLSRLNKILARHSLVSLN